MYVYIVTETAHYNGDKSFRIVGTFYDRAIAVACVADKAKSDWLEYDIERCEVKDSN